MEASSMGNGRTNIQTAYTNHYISGHAKNGTRDTKQFNEGSNRKA